MATYDIANAPNVAGLVEFQSILSRFGPLAQVCRFMAIIHPPRKMINIERRFNLTKDLAFLCESAELPGKAFNVADARYYGPAFKVPTQTLYTDVTLTFMVRDQMYEKEFFDDWMLMINPSNNYNFEYKNNYSSTMDIIQYSVLDSPERKGNSIGGSTPTYKMSLVKAFPINVMPMQTVWGDENFHKLQVQFAYTEWKRAKDPIPTKFTLVSSFGTSITNEYTLQSSTDLIG